ncbi:peptidylprolyl isomerase [Granulosicoccaceae sp. 1_MG-2023]|nr:peptidylprolyl isomerase [Granulosicoccaceae sp. 1_MG-2023]
MSAGPTAHSRSEAIAAGSRITTHYRLSLTDGTVVDATEADAPLAFTLGDGTFPEGVEPLFLGLRAGQSANTTVSPAQGWGQPDPNNIQYLDRSAFDDHASLRPGQTIEFRLPNDDALPGTVLDISRERVRVDFNPPLAGQHVQIDVTIVAVDAPA